ncbi:MAG: hypothetical protein AAF829_11835 [Pseudomonadota bacterium]
MYQFSWPKANPIPGFARHQMAPQITQLVGLNLSDAQLTLFESAILGSLPPHQVSQYSWFEDNGFAFMGRTSSANAIVVAVGIGQGRRGGIALNAGILDLRGAFQRQGIGKLLAKRLLSISLSLGTESVRVSANMAHGSYVWALYGARPFHRSGVEAEIDRRINKLHQAGTWGLLEVNMSRNILYNKNNSNFMMDLARMKRGSRDLGYELLAQGVLPSWKWEGYWDLTDQAQCGLVDALLR